MKLRRMMAKNEIRNKSCKIIGSTQYEYQLFSSVMLPF